MFPFAWGWGWDSILSHLLLGQSSKLFYFDHEWVWFQRECAKLNFQFNEQLYVYKNQIQKLVIIKIEMKINMFDCSLKRKLCKKLDVCLASETFLYFLLLLINGNIFRQIVQTRFNEVYVLTSTDIYNLSLYNHPIIDE
jgi:hypothetical protein